jgi:hypothetical protein
VNSEIKTGPHKVKKTYHSPVLHLYGDIRAMTQSVAAGAKADGMSGLAMQKTA